MSKVCASSREYPHVEKKIKNLREQNFKGTVAQPTVIIIIIIIIYLLITRKYQYTFSPARKRKTSGQKEKSHSKKNNLTANKKRI